MNPIRGISCSLPHSAPFEGPDKESDYLTSISYTLALWRTSPLWFLSSLEFSYKLSHLLINCCLPTWTAADFKEANATLFSLKVCFPKCFKSLFSPPDLLLPLWITPSYILLGVFHLDLLSWSMRLQPTVVSHVWLLKDGCPRAWR